ncbi:hypothetical protein [Alteribacillus sp. YIM 98480]|uniref:hypothetical protein n=1 Tax=Alteribacillus sp. YIM 98480 TaxID=2606599 RepID=UPI00131BD115|nr:hypothetical protein [Alteribacillus sp. YIM 98480]
MSSASAYSLEIPSVRQWKAKISFPYAASPGLVAREQGACAFLIKTSNYEIDSNNNSFSLRLSLSGPVLGMSKICCFATHKYLNNVEKTFDGRFLVRFSYVIISKRYKKHHR